MPPSRLELCLRHANREASAKCAFGLTVASGPHIVGFSSARYPFEIFGLRQSPCSEVFAPPMGLRSALPIITHLSYRSQPPSTTSVCPTM